MAYPISQGRALNIAAVVHTQEEEGKVYPGPLMSEVGAKEVTRYYSGWEPDVQLIMKVSINTATGEHNVTYPWFRISTASPSGC